MQIHVAQGKKQKLFPWITTLGWLYAIRLLLYICPSGWPLVERLDDILLKFRGCLEFLLRLRRNVGILIGWFQRAVNLGKVGLAEGGLRLIRLSVIGQPATLTQEAPAVKGVCILRSL